MVPLSQSTPMADPPGTENPDPPTSRLQELQARGQVATVDQYDALFLECVGLNGGG